MYGTIARMKVKPGIMEELKKMEERKPRGFVRSMVYRLDKDPDELMMVVVFKDKESYFANANSPEMNGEYLKYRALLTEDPEWYDGEIVLDTESEMAKMG
jgi:quinol monooxygenase YgiN